MLEELNLYTEQKVHLIVFNAQKVAILILKTSLKLLNVKRLF